MKFLISDRLTSFLLVLTMFSLTLLSWFAPFTPPVAYGTADNKSSKQTNGFFNDELAKVSYGLALLEANARYMDELECFIHRQLGEQTKTENESDKAATSDISRLLERERNEKNEWCAIFVDVAKDTKDIAQAALRANAIPTEGFLFYAWRHDDLFLEKDKENEVDKYKAGKFPPGPNGEPVGLFKTLESCQTAEARLRQLDRGTRPCRPWENSWLATIVAPKEKSKETIDFGKALWDGIRTLVPAGVIYLIYSFATTVYVSAAPKTKKQRRKDYLQSLGFVLLGALFMWAMYGIHFESDDDSDPLHPTGSYVQDFKPTEKERNEHGLTIFLTLLVPVWLGVKKAHDQTPFL